MAAKMGLSPEILETEAFPPDKGLEKSKPHSGLMERLRSRCNQHKSWTDSMKAIRMAIANDKRSQADALEKSSIYQNCLDKLHRAMKITSQQSLIERLDLISRQLGMIFTPPSHSDNQVVLSSEMFKVVVVLEGQSGIRDVKVGHQETPVSCEDLVDVLSKGNFEEFVSHLQGLLAIYSIHGDRKQKNKGYLALSSLEYDLNQLAQLQSSINGVANYIHKSPLGILLPRRGGHPMKLIYFVSPYDLLCKRSKSSHPMTVEAITENGLGHSVTVSLEPCPHVNKLQTIPLMSVRQNQDGKSLPSFQNVNNINSYSLSASFVLVLPQPIPVAKSVIDAIKDITGLDVICGEEKSFLSVLLHNSNASMSSGNELFVTLPDQQHVYFFNNSVDGCLGQLGALVNKIPFTLPTCVPKVLNLLRQQLTFNSVIHSLVRPYSKREYRSGVVFELTAVSLQYLSLMFEHPLHHAMITVEFDLSDLTSVHCSVNMNNKDKNICTDDFVSKAFQRSFSIPVTLRSVIKKVNEQIKLLVPPDPVVKPIVKSRWTWTRKSPVKKLVTTNTSTVQTPNMVSNFTTNPPPYQNAENWTPTHSPKIEMHKYSIQLNQNPPPEPPVAAQEEFHEQRPAANPLLATLLDAGSPSVEQPVAPVVNESPMLSKLLEENTSVASNPFPAPNPNPRKRLTKRKSSKDIAGKSPKHRISDTEMAERTSNERVGSERHGQGMGEKHIDLDSSGGSYEELGRPTSVSSVGSVGGQSTGSVIDLTDIGESHVKKLENSLDSIMGKESPRGGAMMGLGHPLNNQMTGLDMLDMYPVDFHHGQNPNQFMGDGSGDFHPPPQWPSRQTPPTPTSRNSPHHGVVPKNEKTSTSLEELLLGPGGREIGGPNAVYPQRNSQQRRPSFKRQNSLGRSSVDSASGVISPDIFSPLMTSPGQHPLASPNQFPISSPSYIVSPGFYPQMSPSQFPTVTSPSIQNITIKSEPSDSKAGILGSQMPISTSRISNMHVAHVTSSGKPSLSMMKAQLDLKNDLKQSAITQEREGFKEENSNSSTNSQPPLMKLKLTNMKQYDTVSPADSDISKRSSTFDFHSDDEDFSLPMVEKMTVVSASPTRLQISNKSTLASFNRFNKSEKFKRKQKEHELKITLSVDSGKRKREKDESKKERKKKKIANSSYSVENDMAVYKSVTVDNISSQNDHLPKLKITKKGLKMSVENSVLKSKDGIAVDKTNKLDKGGKEAIVKIEKMEKVLNKEVSEKEIKSSKEKNSKPKEKTSEKDKVSTAVARTPSASDEGIFDKINAMKSENVSKNNSSNIQVVEKNSSHDSVSKKSSSSSKSTKSHKSQRSASSTSSKSNSKMARTPTIKLKPIVVPASSSGLNVSRNPSTPGTPSTPKSITQSPTSATIGKIGAVSLATSGTQKQLTPSSSKSPQGSSAKSSGSSSKSSSGSSSASASKSSSGMQKNFQIQGSSGKNSPNPHSSKSGYARSSSTSTLNSGSSNSKLDKSKSISSSSIRTSSPLSEKEKSKSSSRSSSSSGRDRERSTSSSKTSVPTTTVITQETAASVLSFLNPNKIAKLPPIPKLSSTAGSQKVSTPTTTSNPVVSTSTAPTYSSTSTTNSKFSKGSNPVTSVSSKGSISSVTANSSKASISSANHVKNSYLHNKGTSGNHTSSSNSRPQNQMVTNAANTNRNSGNSPQSYQHKHEKGSNSSYNKGNNQTSANNSSSGYRNNYNSGNNSQNRNSGMHNSNSHSNWSSNSPNMNSHTKPNNSNTSGQRGSNSSHNGNKGSNSNSDGAIPRTSTVSNTSNISNSKGSNSVQNAPKGPGPPVSRQQSNDKGKTGSSSVSPVAAARGRKGSLSAVIDKLTCKAAVPTGSVSSQKVNQVIVNESPASPEMDAVVAETKEESKVVIFEAPASPEPESCVNSAPKNRINSAREIVSIPLENEPENANDTSYSSEQTGIKLNNSEYRKDHSFPKANVTLNSSPKIIPLNSPKDKPSSHRNSPVNRKSIVKQAGVEMVNSFDKQNGEVEDHHTKHASVSNDINNSYSNSQSDLPVNDAKVKGNIFKTPASKPQENSEINFEDIENLGGRRNFRQNSMPKTMSDSSSPASSPENGLIIDFPSSPRHLQNKTNSPQCNPVSDSFIESRTSPNFLKSPGLKSKLKTSPPPSPSGKESSLGSSANSPEALDDDLMDEALGFGN